MKLRRKRQLDLQAKISLVLAGVIIPTSLIVTIAENKLTRPIFEEEMRQIGVTSGKTLAAEIVGGRLLSSSDPTPAIESKIQELLYAQPNIIRIDVIDKEGPGGSPMVVGSSVEGNPEEMPQGISFTEAVTSEMSVDDDTGEEFWEVNVPI